MVSLAIKSDKVRETSTHICAQYEYRRTIVENVGNKTEVAPIVETYEFLTDKRIPRIGLMLVGLGGNNGTTVVGGITANKKDLSWETKNGTVRSNYFGSLTQASTVRLGISKTGEEIFVPLASLLPMVNPNDIVVSGWDLNKDNLGVAMKKAKVFDHDLQQKLIPSLTDIIPLPSLYYPEFIAENQRERVNNAVDGSKACKEHLDKIRTDIRNFKRDLSLDKIFVLWTANTERCCEETEGVHDTSGNIIKAISNGHPEISPSQVFAVASLLEDCTFINGSPQNTLVPGIVHLAEERGVFICGDDLKTGQTKMKSMMVEYMINAGFKPECIVSYNHLGNNDGRNLDSPSQFKSKEKSKSNVVNDMVKSNQILYEPGETPDHAVVIKYVPFVGDSKRAMDEYTASIFMGGTNTVIIHNTCEDSLLAAPVIIDLVILAELMERITYTRVNPDTECGHSQNGANKRRRMHSVLSILGYLLKAPKVPRGTPVVNALSRQRTAIENLLRACVGLPAESHILLEHKSVSNMC